MRSTSARSPLEHHVDFSTVVVAEMIEAYLIVPPARLAPQLLKDKGLKQLWKRLIARLWCVQLKGWWTTGSDASFAGLGKEPA